MTLIMSGRLEVQTPLAGLVDIALTAPDFADLAERAGRRPAELAVVGPASAQLFVVCAFAGDRSRELGRCWW